MKKPLFSVFMSCYNHGKYVSVAIESILNQTFQDFELLVADNGSTDDSYEVIKKYSDRIKVFHLDKNDPFGCSRMLVDKCCGEYICQMAADDYWEADKLELQVREIEKNPNCIAYFTWASFADENLKVTNENVFSYQYSDRYEWLRNIFEHGTILAINTVAIKNDKNLYRKYMEKNVTQLWNLTDQRQIINMLRQGQVSVVPKSCMKIRRSDNCIGAVSDETILRTNNETIAIWWDLWENLRDDEFVKIFQNDLINKNSKSHTEVQCEKMLVYLKLAEKKFIHQTNAINFFITHYNDEGVAELLETEYGYSIESFRQYTGECGLPLMINMYLSEKEQNEKKQIQENKLLIGENVKNITDLNLRICNSIIEKNGLDQAIVADICTYYQMMALLKKVIPFSEEDYLDISQEAEAYLENGSIEKTEKILNSLQMVREITFIRYLQMM